jgi:two-component system response regulator HydG
MQTLRRGAHGGFRRSEHASARPIRGQRRDAGAPDLAERAAASDAKVLVTGESGAGKDIVARHVHDHSNAGGEFVPVNCAGVTETLLESELFGHVKGSFTGAYRDKIGKLRLAHHGTLFLDEDRRDEPADAGAAAPLLENGEIQAVGIRQRARRRSKCASSPRPIEVSPTWSRRAPSARICCTGFA